ncbi:MAG: redox-regulated ATPase YchF [Candidatus Omnitrophica bacterium]|nr:redox-regulated ATPase YchF [Candidatus Omnitrophota bacterium]
MKIALIGPPQSGKTTTFFAIVGPQSHPSDHQKSSIATLSFFDERLDRLADIVHSRKKTYLHLELLDSPQLCATPDKGLNFAQVREADGFTLVLNAYSPDAKPILNFQTISSELLLKDVEVLEPTLQKLELDLKKGRKEREKEHPVLVKCQDALQKQTPLRKISFTPEEEKWLKPYEFLSKKPLSLIVNIAERDIGKKGVVLDDIAKVGFPWIAFCAKTEKELLELEESERKSFITDLGIEQLARESFLRAAFQAFHVISFFTVVGEEARAWSLQKGKNVLDAAGKIHTDMARGFIKAEVFSCEELFTHGSLHTLREKGRLRLEGKEYIVQEGDVLNIKFGV